MDALARWRILRLHVEDVIPLTTLARETDVGVRTLQRWKRLYLDGGIDALHNEPRSDRGTRRIQQELISLVERLALTRPRPSIATLHRLACAEAGRNSFARPSYSTIRSIVQSLDPGLVTLALEAAGLVPRQVRARVPATSGTPQRDLAGRPHSTRHSHTRGSWAA